MKFFLFLTNLIIPCIMAVSGWIISKHPPKKINYAIGYRTKRSMRSPEAWMFAQTKMGAIWKKVGAIMLIASSAAQIPLLFLSVDAFSIASLITMFAQLAVLLLTIPPIERALKKAFPDIEK